MKNSYKPNIYVKDIYSINYKKLKEKGIKYLLFDIDNTISPTNEKTPNKKVIDLFKTLKKEGFIIIILTNAIPLRANRFKKHLSVDTFSLSFKPHKRNYLRIIKKYKINDLKTIAAIGDQIYTDIKGANCLSITSILVDQISNKESLFTKINRLKENFIIKRSKIITRGEYYE